MNLNLGTGRRRAGLHAQAALSLGKRTFGTHCNGGWIGPKVYLDAVEKRNSLASAKNRTLLPRSSRP
jgi:hypothetical protein